MSNIRYREAQPHRFSGCYPDRVRLKTTGLWRGSHNVNRADVGQSRPEEILIPKYGYRQHHQYQEHGQQRQPLTAS